MATVLDEDRLTALTAPLASDEETALAPPPARPFHVVYGGAHRFSRDTATKLGRLAREALAEHAPDPAHLTELVGLGGDEALAAQVYERLARKLARQPIEDLRVDFEDGFGPRSDEEEDREAARAGIELAAAAEQGSLPPFVGVRVKALRGRTAKRALSTLDLFLSAAGSALEALPSFVVTLPKVESAAELVVLCDALEAIEPALALPHGHIGVEVMVESPRGLIGPGGRLRVPDLVEAGRGRVRSVHLGTYDYLGALGITAPHQAGDHPAADLARQLLKLSVAGADVTVSDGATHLMPIGPHRARGAALDETQREENRAVVKQALQVHSRGIRRALETGIYCGWDLHPTQLLARWATTFAFFLDDLEEQTARLAAYLERARAAARTGAMFEDAASAQGLFHTFLRGRAAGALDDDDLARAGIE